MTKAIYLLLLKLYPRSFRDRFGAEMLEFFQAKQAAGTARGPMGRLLFWIDPRCTSCG